MKGSNTGRQKVKKKVGFSEVANEIEDKPVNEYLKAANARDAMQGRRPSGSELLDVPLPLEQIEETAEVSINNRTGSIGNDDYARDLGVDNQQYNSHTSKQSKVRQTSIMDAGVFENGGAADFERTIPESPVLSSSRDRNLKDNNGHHLNWQRGKDCSNSESSTDKKLKRRALQETS